MRLFERLLEVHERLGHERIFASVPRRSAPDVSVGIGGFSPPRVAAEVMGLSLGELYSLVQRGLLEAEDVGERELWVRPAVARFSAVSRTQGSRRDVLLVGAVLVVGVFLLGVVVVKGLPQITEFAFGPECEGGVIQPVSVEEARAALEEQGFDVQVPGRSSACAGVAAAALEETTGTCPAFSGLRPSMTRRICDFLTPLAVARTS